MSSNPRRRNGVSPTTIILVLILLGAVAGASRLVSPPPPEPPKPAPVQAVDPALQQKQERSRMDMYQNKMKMDQASRSNGAGTIKVVQDPNQVEITDNYARTHMPGAAGLAQMDKEYEAKTAAYKKYLRERDEYEKKHPLKPSPPMMTPPMAAPKAAK
jgi:hypothetical protein